MNALRSLIPHTRWPDSTIALALDPYRFVSRMCARLNTDVFQSRLFLRRTIFMIGKEAAELLTDPSRFTRRKAAPRAVRHILFGRGAVQTLDGEAHRHRKAMFMSLVTPERVRYLASIMDEHLRAHARAWEQSGRVTLYAEMREILTRSVCAWAGVPLEEFEVPRRTMQLSALFELPGRTSPVRLLARVARKQAERWCSDLIEQVRTHRLHVTEETALFRIAWHREPSGALLDTHTAAVELLNVLRPTVAVSGFIVFLALAIHHYPEYRDRLRDDDAFLDAFVQEVRRFYPFVPLIPARVRHNFSWKGYRFPKGVRVLLDIYGTNHDCRLWEQPDSFRPERFLGKDVDMFALIPQGPGDPFLHHRCAGEGITIALMKVAARFLSTGIHYEVPRQDLRLQWRRVPALPRSRFVLTNITTIA